MTYSITDRSRSSAWPKKDSPIEALNKILKGVALWKSRMPFVQGALIAKPDYWISYMHLYGTGPSCSQQIFAPAAFHQDCSRKEFGCFTQIVNICTMRQMI